MDLYKDLAFRTPDPTPTSSQQPTSTFGGGLFDFSFTHFITLKFISAIYAVNLVVIGLIGVVCLIALVSRGDGTDILAGLIVVPLLTLLWIIVVRLILEVIAVIFRIGENTTRIADAEEARTSAVE
jgi:hypothetical protein